MTTQTQPKDEWAGGEEVQANWFKFEKVGDGIKGTLTAKTFQKSNKPGFPDQYVFELQKADGSLWNVGVSVNKKGTCQRLNSCQVGEIIGIRFETESPAQTKGFAPSKNLKVLTFGMSDEYLSGGLNKKESDIPFA